MPMRRSTARRIRGAWARPADTLGSATASAAVALALLAGSTAGLGAQSGPVIDSMLPESDTLVVDAEPLDQEFDIDFAYCIKYENAPIQFLSQKGVIGWRDPVAGDAVVRVDSTDTQLAAGTCPSGWQLGALTNGFQRGRYRVWYGIEIVDGNGATFTDSVSVDSVFIFDTSPTLTIGLPTDSVQVTGTASVDTLDLSTNLGPSQLIRVIRRFTPEGGGASTVLGTDTLYTNANGSANRGVIPLDQGDGEYVVVAETDSLPIADNPPDVDSPGRDQIVRRLNQSGPGVAIVLPAADSSHGQQFEVHGRSQPTARVTIDQCDACSALGDTVIAGPDSVWTFGTVDFPTTGTNTVRVIAYDTVALNNTTGIPDTAAVTFDVRANRPPTLSVVEPTADTVLIAVGDSVRFLAQADDPDGDPVTVTWYFSPTDTAFAGTPPGTVVGEDAGYVAFVPADTFLVTAVARDDRGATSEAVDRTVVALPRGPNVDTTTPGSETRVDGHDVVFVIRAMLTGDARADVNGDGMVDDTDLGLVTAAFGQTAAPVP